MNKIVKICCNDGMLINVLIYTTEIIFGICQTKSQKKPRGNDYNIITSVCKLFTHMKINEKGISNCWSIPKRHLNHVKLTCLSFFILISAFKVLTFRFFGCCNFLCPILVCKTYYSDLISSSFQLYTLICSFSIPTR